MKIFAVVIISCFTLHAICQIPASGGKLRPAQANIDVKHYRINIDLDVDRRFIKGNTTVSFNIFQPTNVLEFDLVDSFNITKVLLNSKTQSFDLKIIL